MQVICMVGVVVFITALVLTLFQINGAADTGIRHQMVARAAWILISLVLITTLLIRG